MNEAIIEAIIKSLQTLADDKRANIAALERELSDLDATALAAHRSSSLIERLEQPTLAFVVEMETVVKTLEWAVSIVEAGSADIWPENCRPTLEEVMNEAAARPDINDLKSATWKGGKLTAKSTAKSTTEAATSSAASRTLAALVKYEPWMRVRTVVARKGTAAHPLTTLPALRSPSRRWGVTGTVTGEDIHGGHGPYHAVRHDDDGTIGYYDPAELEPLELSPPPRELLRASMFALKELRRLRGVLMPQYEGKVAEPDIEVIERLEAAIAAAATEVKT